MKQQGTNMTYSHKNKTFSLMLKEIAKYIIKQSTQISLDKCQVCQKEKEATKEQELSSRMVGVWVQTWIPWQQQQALVQQIFMLNQIQQKITIHNNHQDHLLINAQRQARRRSNLIWTQMPTQTQSQPQTLRNSMHNVLLTILFLRITQDPSHLLNLRLHNIRQMHRLQHFKA